MAEGLRVPGRGIWALALVAACGAEEPKPPAPAPPQIDLSEYEPTEALEVVLKTCLGPVRGTLDRCLIQITGELAPDGATVSLWLPDMLRFDHGQRTVLLREAVAWDCARGGEPRQLTDTECAPWQRLRELLAAATLQPLEQPRTVERQAKDRYRVTVANGESWDLTLTAGTAVPEKLVGPHGELRVIDHTRTSVSWIPRRVKLGELGEHELMFRDSNVKWDELFFTDPADRITGALPQGKPPEKIVWGGERQPSTPEVLADRARFWLLVDDPGSWTERSQLVQKHFAILQKQRQKLAGFVAFCEEDGEPRMMIPFRPRKDGPPFVRPADWVVRRAPQGRALVVYPEHGTFASMVTAGEELLTDALKRGGHRARGPICAQPYVDLQDGVPTEKDYAELLVRMSVAIE